MFYRRKGIKHGAVYEARPIAGDRYELVVAKRVIASDTVEIRPREITATELREEFEPTLFTGAAEPRNPIQ